MFRLDRVVKTVSGEAAIYVEMTESSKIMQPLQEKCYQDSMENAVKAAEAEFPDLKEYEDEIVTMGQVTQPEVGETSHEFLVRLYKAVKQKRLQQASAAMTAAQYGQYAQQQSQYIPQYIPHDYSQWTTMAGPRVCTNLNPHGLLQPAIGKIGLSAKTEPPKKKELPPVEKPKKRMIKLSNGCKAGLCDGTPGKDGYCQDHDDLRKSP
jgi:hypothetical protein